MKFILFYAFISFIIFYIIVRINYKLRHKFWSEQPVSNNIYFQFYEGIIDDKIKKPLKINNNFLLF